MSVIEFGVSGLITGEKQRDIVGLIGSPRKGAHRIENGFLETFQGRFMLAEQKLAQPRHPEHLVVRVHGFGNAVAV
jgi:hypothetical protein